MPKIRSRLARRAVGAGVALSMMLGAGAALAARKPKREVPNYDGRKDPPPTAGEVLIWIPRVAMFPLYLVSEYVVRKPLGLLITTAEKNRWPTLVLNIFTFGPERKAGIVPTFLIDFGFRPSFGFFFFWNDLGARGHGISIRGATGGRDWLTLAITDRYEVADDRGFVKLRLEGTRRLDKLFYGIGPTANSDRFRYGVTFFAGHLETAVRPWRSSSVGLHAGVRSVRFRAKTCCTARAGTSELGESITNGDLEPPPGWGPDATPGAGNGYSIFYYGAFATLDTRPKSTRGTGIVVHGFVEHSTSLLISRNDHWVRYGGAVTGFVDLTRTKRVLGLGVVLSFVDPLSGSEVPFTELSSLGGGGGAINEEPMQGFLSGRLRDRSAVVVYLDYEWPIWIWLSGYLRTEMGNVFGPHLRDNEATPSVDESFDFGLMRLSFGFGFRTTKLGDNPFQLLFAIGTSPFDDSFKIDSFRFVVGTTRGF